LTQAIRAILGLEIIRWIPVRVDDNNLVCGSDIEAETAGFGGDEEDERTGVGVEFVDNCLRSR
jgi:hypothetical protein